MKKLALLCVLLAVVASGCGKKKEKSQTRSKVTTKSRSISKNKNLALKDSEEFFDNEALSDFAFIDDENSKNTKSLNKDKDLALVQNDTELAMPQNEDLVDDEAEENGMAFKTVYFDLNHNKIRSDQKKIVAEDCNLAKDAAKNGKKVVVHGHCCQIGSQSYNMALSQQRAQAIKKEMVQNGVPEETIKVVGYGSQMPVIWSEKKDRSSLVKELAPNRRAEVMVS